MSDRKQFVTIDNNLSDLLNIILGVPQGSILGPLLFLVHINDLPECSKLLSLLFADDMYNPTSFTFKPGHSYKHY